MTDEYVLKSSVLKSIHNGDIDMGIVTTHEYYLLRKLSKKIDRRIQRVPAADVQPVRHGQWISDAPGKRFGTVVRLDKDGCPVDPCHCSECGEWLTASDEYPVIGYYCPNCGAKMDNPVDYCFGAKIVE